MDQTPVNEKLEHSSSEIINDFSQTYKYKEMNEEINEHQSNDDPMKEFDVPNIPENGDPAPISNLEKIPDIADIREDLLFEAELAQINTLNEPVTITINRDLKLIGNKLRYVLIPKFSFFGTKEDDKTRSLRQWDLWGPIFLSMTLSLTLSISTTTASGATLFIVVFLTIFCGAAVVTFNAKLLGGKISLLQTVGVLGYCLFPICISTLLLALLGSLMVFWGKIVICTVAFIWSSLSSLSFMRNLVPHDRQFLGIYPVLLFYIFLSWFALTI